MLFRAVPGFAATALFGHRLPSNEAIEWEGKGRDNPTETSNSNGRIQDLPLLAGPKHRARLPGKWVAATALEMLPKYPR